MPQLIKHISSYLLLQLHLVHWNTKYGLMSKAVEQPDGLAVVGIFLQVVEDAEDGGGHPELDKVVELFGNVRYRNMKADFQAEIEPERFLPEDRSYWYYPGSLTTPPLNESVLWHVMRQPVKVSRKQVGY